MQQSRYAPCFPDVSSYRHLSLSFIQTTNRAYLLVTVIVSLFVVNRSMMTKCAFEKKCFSSESNISWQIGFKVWFVLLQHQWNWLAFRSESTRITMNPIHSFQWTFLNRLYVTAFSDASQSCFVMRRFMNPCEWEAQTAADYTNLPRE